MSARIAAIEPYWKKLRQLRLATWYKLLAIRLALLPRALYGCSNVRLGRCWIRKLRTGAMRALRWNRPGASPLLRRSCVAPTTTDPGFYEANLTLREFQANLQISPEMRRHWHDYALLNFSRRTHGPFAKIEDVCHSLLWGIDECAVVQLPDGLEFSLLKHTFDAVEMVLTYSWHQFVAWQLEARQDYAGLNGLDHHASFRQLTKLSLADNELLNCIKDGTFHLRSYKSKFDSSVDEYCPHCDLADTLRHRALICPHFEQVRQQFPDCTMAWDQLPTALTHHGLCSANPWQWSYWAALEAIDPQPSWHLKAVDQGTQHLFTDASCLSPTRPTLALCAWAVISAEASKPVASGLLPGFYHTINRGEVWAIIMALQWACENGVPVEIWSDSQYAVHGFSELAELHTVPLELGLFWLQQLEHAPVFHKVAAHRDHTKASNACDAWAFQHNNLADLAAKAAVICPGDSQLRDLRQKLLASDQQNSHYAERYQLFLLALAKQGLEHAVVTVDAAEDESGELDLTLHGEVNTGDFIELFPVDVNAALHRSTVLPQMGISFAQKMVSWLRELSQEADYTLEVTTLELCVGYLAAGHVLPCQINFGSGPVWVNPEDYAVGELLGHTLAAKHSAFLALLKAIAAAFSCEWLCGSSARLGSGVHRRFSTAYVPWPLRLAQRVQALLLSFTSTRPMRSSADLARTLHV